MTNEAHTTQAPTLREMLTARWEKVADELIATGRFPTGETRASFVQYWVNTDLATTH